MEALLLVAEHDGPTMFARIGIMRALNRGHVREFNPSRKDLAWDAASWREIDDEPGIDADGVAENEAGHFTKCPGCSQWFDTRDLARVVEHVHDSEIEVL